jgi:hypothetical protein
MQQVTAEGVWFGNGRPIKSGRRGLDRILPELLRDTARRIRDQRLPFYMIVI